MFDAGTMSWSVFSARIVSFRSRETAKTAQVPRRFPVEVTAEGTFYHRFQEEDPPTGVYRAHLEGRLPDHSDRLWRSREVSFRIEAYRIPRFEVNLHAPDRVPLDRAFEVFHDEEEALASFIR